MAAGRSAQLRAEELRAQAAQARVRADALELEAGAWAAGADGERRVAALLNRLPEGWCVHHDRLLRPGRSQTNLDHIVIGPSGVYLVDTKNWAGGTSVHEGTVWQHASSSSPKGRELDMVSRFAAEMEKGLELPVVPVIALAGRQSSAFDRQRVRGVEIIPQDDLVSWLLAQPAPVDQAEAGMLLARRVDHRYPSAAAEPSVSDDATSLTVADIVGPDSRSHAKASRAHITPTIRRTPVNRRGRRPRRRRGSTMSALVGLLALMALSQLGPRLLPQLLSLSTSGSPSPLVGPGRTPPPPTVKQCHALATATIQRITGSKTVLEKPQIGDDRCTWWLSKPRYSTQAADLTVETGQTVRVQLAATGLTASRIDVTPGEVSAWLPKNTSVGDSRTKSRARQPFVITLRFAYPPGASQQEARAVEAAAEMKVTGLAEALVTVLPADRTM